jgi:catechol 2,3-dioxygenase-like lactoylglutathione lyase family enzyme
MNQIAEIARVTDDVTDLVQFYERVLGAAPRFRSSGMALFKLSNFTLFIHKAQRQTADQPLHEAHLSVAVEDVDRACAELQAQGVALLLAPHNYEWGRSAYLRDPDGRLIELQDMGQTGSL